MIVRPRSEIHRKTFEWWRSSFLEEARILVLFRHPSIVRVTRFFEAFSTAYMVMDFEGCPKGSDEERELATITNVIVAYEAVRWPKGRVEGGKG